ncbi:Zinc finger protein 641 [Portunus trituberculatus]|uniref:Zinc finger protein 641 n=2 Tax=Portunus trituberculatus TaxID=210409 RepID=A0A5B7JHA2_PORTR|nr:Zinc finger protein 641 [Portunus trituberculatus]
MGGSRAAEKRDKRAAGAGAGVVKVQEAEGVEEDELGGSEVCHFLPGLRCPECGKVFYGRNRRQLVVRHRIIHTGEKPFQCPLCFKRMNVKHHLTRHLRTVHLDQWEYLRTLRLL